MLPLHNCFGRFKSKLLDIIIIVVMMITFRMHSYGFRKELIPSNLDSYEEQLHFPTWLSVATCEKTAAICASV